MEPDTPPCLVLVPGLACDAAVWQPLLPALTPACRPWVPPPEVLPSIGAMAQAILDAAPGGQFALAGHSLGGRIALEVVRRAPGRVLRLALLDTGCAPLPAGPAGRDEADQRLALVALARREGMRAMAERWAPPMLHPAHQELPVFEEVLAMLARQSVDRFEAQQHALLARPDATAVLDSLVVPTLVLCGEQDTWSPPARHREMASRVSGARLSLVPHCGHMSPMEQPAAVAAALLGWLHEAH
jgi:pimeloyl-ACP methyl ester carboxylesterase